MNKKKYNDDLFPYLNWLSKKTSILSIQQFPTAFITNRWLSMIDSSYAQIVNVTINRWINKTFFSKENEIVGKFYRLVLPKINKKFSYIKRNSKETTDSSEISLYAETMELSQREIQLYNNTLEELKQKVK